MQGMLLACSEGSVHPRQHPKQEPCARRAAQTHAGHSPPHGRHLGLQVASEAKIGDAQLGIGAALRQKQVLRLQIALRGRGTWRRSVR